jgi:hypothetical protein
MDYPFKAFGMGTYILWTSHQVTLHPTLAYSPRAMRIGYGTEGLLILEWGNSRK